MHEGIYNSALRCFSENWKAGAEGELYYAAMRFGAEACGVYLRVLESTHRNLHSQPHQQTYKP